MKDITESLQKADGIKGLKGHLEQRISVLSKDAMLGQELRGVSVGINPSENLGAYSIMLDALNFDDLFGHIALVGAYEPGRYAERLAMSQYDRHMLDPIAVFKDAGIIYVKGTIKTADFISIEDTCGPDTYRIEKVYREIAIPFSAKEFKARIVS